MPETNVSYAWLKLWSKEWLTGSLRFDCTPAQRGIWADLLALANQSRNRGVIQANITTPYPHDWIAKTLNITIEELESALENFKNSGRIEENGTGIKIINFEFYNPSKTTGKVGRPSKKRDVKTDDKNPEKYFKGKYGHMVEK